MGIVMGKPEKEIRIDLSQVEAYKISVTPLTSTRWLVFFRDQDLAVAVYLSADQISDLIQRALIYDRERCRFTGASAPGASGGP